MEGTSGKRQTALAQQRVVGFRSLERRLLLLKQKITQKSCESGNLRLFVFDPVICNCSAYQCQLNTIAKSN
jgi:hypothetical protein